MTVSGPPWSLFGAGSPEPETPAAEKTGPEGAGPQRAPAAPAGQTWERQTSPEPVKAEPPWARQASPEPVKAEPPWAGLPEPGAAEGAPPRARVHGLSARLTALTRLIQIGSARTGAGGFSQELLRDAEELEERAGERLRLSAGHTVVALAGGTGSGKSALFNQLAGHDFSAVGVTRPVTREPHACVWGTAG